MPFDLNDYHHDDLELLPGDLVFFETCAVSGAVIRALQRGIYGDIPEACANHVATCVDSPDLLKEATIPYSKLRHSREVHDRRTVAVARPRHFPAHTARRWADSEIYHVGQWYGLPQIFGMLYYGVMTACGHRPRTNPIRSGVICTEMASYHID